MTEETLAALREKSAALPRRPGVYIMKDVNGRVIYVGKSRSLRDRVSQDFHLGRDAGIKTRRMVSCVYDFDFLLCDTEIEALTLENSKIKQYAPKYNVKLKDAKSYPYIKLTMQDPYPRMQMTRQRAADGAKYYGPYSGVSTVYEVMKTLEKYLKIPTCKREFPRDIGKERPCIYKQLGRCVAPCDNSIGQKDYYEILQCAAGILRGNTRNAIAEAEAKMYEAAEREEFEEAARYRDRLMAIKKLGESQKVVASPDAEYDIIAEYTDDVSTCVSVFYIRNGIVFDSESFTFGAGEVTENEAGDYSFMTSLIARLYSSREYIPKEILLSFDPGDNERETLSSFLVSLAGRKVEVRTPERGERRQLCRMVAENAMHVASEFRRKAENDVKVLVRLASLLSLEVVPERIEAYDISNLGAEHITAGMIVSENGSLKRSDYRTFKIKDADGPDDYEAMRQTIRRRFAHLTDGEGSFSEMPDLILLDGGMTHVGAVKEVLSELGLSIPTFGMVKDEHHKTRTIVTETEELSIANDQAVFVFVYKLQEEVHRYTVSRMDSAKRKTLRRSALESIPGIGPAKAKALHRHFGTVAAMREASLEDFRQVTGITEKDAESLLRYFEEKN